MSTIQEFARHLDLARLEAREVARLTETREMSRSEAYEIQEAGIQLRCKSGEKIVGYKMGLTSQAKRSQMGLHEAIYGVLTDRMQIFADTPYSLHDQIHPKAEPEIAFHVVEALDARQGPISEDLAWSAVGEVAPAIEILDSRFVGFKYFSLPDVIADNASSSQFLLGPAVSKPAHWSEMEGWQLEFLAEGKLLHKANGSEISGSPIRSLTELAHLLAERGQLLHAGSWVLAGAATAAVALSSGQKIELILKNQGGNQRLGQVGFSVHS